MSESHAFADVSLPVPIEHSFTYRLPETLRHRARPGCRLLVPFGSRRLNGFILRVHNDPPAAEARDALRLLDEEPVLDAELLSLGQWIASYYCAPLGEVLRGMVPLAGEVRHGKIYFLTDAGRDVARRFLTSPADGAPPEDKAVRILKLLETRQMTALTLAKKVDRPADVLRGLEKKGLVEAEDVESGRDPLRASAVRLRVEFLARAEEKLPKAERELLAYLELHPGGHNLASLEEAVAHASRAARALARRNLIALRPENPASGAGPPRAPHRLNPHQQAAFEQIRASLEARAFQTFLMEGVTGSGKTEVYLRAIETAVAMGRGALLLVPEIALTPAVAGQFFHRFGERVAILHSAFHDTERAEQWRRIRSGGAGVVVATRSGVFAPVRDLGLIIVDEEHDNSYKQQETPRYHGRDVAIVRAKAAGASVVLGSATPSLESKYNVGRGKYTLLELPERIEKRALPEVRLIDMRAEFLETRKQSTFSRALIDAIGERLRAGEQSMILLNRRGFSSFVACRSCGERLECVNCAVTLTHHRRDRRMLCHYCNYAAQVPAICPKCHSEHMHFVGIGSERVEDELHRDLPAARIARMDRDTVSGKRHFENILSEFRAGNFDILVGTQMIAKGHDIPNVTLVGVVSADIGLGMPDFRAAERTFQLLTQAAGRAGRGDLPGLVLIQTTNPEHYAIRCAAAQDYRMFYEKELQFRRLLRYPPFSALANVLVRDSSREEALRRATDLGRLLDPAPEGLKILGPAEAPVPRLKAEYRYQILVKSASRKRLNEILNQLRAFAAAQRWNSAALVIDVDPVTLL